MVISRRERLREATYAEIKEVARRQMEQEGTAGLSLRGIAQKMGMTAPALYRYYENRDALVTTLIVEGFEAMGGMLEAADASQKQDDYGGRLRTTSLAYRDWAIMHRTDHALLFGNPIPGYHAPGEVTIPAAQRSTATFLLIFGGAYQAGQLKVPPEYQSLPSALEEVLQGWLNDNGVNFLPPGLMALAFTIWAELQGLVIQELNGHLPPGVTNDGKLYRFELERILERIGLV